MGAIDKLKKKTEHKIEREVGKLVIKAGKKGLKKLIKK